MRLRTLAGQSIGGGTTLDWEMTDRGDRALHEVFLAYTAYFAVAKVADSDENRVILVPAADSAPIPATLNRLQPITVSASTVTSYLVARAVLSYAEAVVGVLAETQRMSGDPWRRTALRGVHVTTYWKPNPNTFAVDRRLLAPLPRWLLPLYRQSGDQAAVRETLELHRRRLDNIHGAWRDEKKLGGATRAAFDSYLESLSGDAAGWFRAVASWFPAARERGEDKPTRLWTEDEVRRIAVVLNQALVGSQSLAEIIGHESFKAMARAIRQATIRPHYARLRQRQGGRGDGATTDANQGASRSPFDAQYDLINTLLEANDRSRVEFERELFRFVARYNDETMRDNEKARREDRRPLIRELDLQQVLTWVERDTKGVVPLALLAFGSSVVGTPRQDSDADADNMAPPGANGPDETTL